GRVKVGDDLLDAAGAEWIDLHALLFCLIEEVRIAHSLLKRGAQSHLSVREGIGWSGERPPQSLQARKELPDLPLLGILGQLGCRRRLRQLRLLLQRGLTDDVEQLVRDELLVTALQSAPGQAA